MADADTEHQTMKAQRQRKEVSSQILANQSHLRQASALPITWKQTRSIKVITKSFSTKKENSEEDFEAVYTYAR